MRFSNIPAAISIVAILLACISSPVDAASEESVLRQLKNPVVSDATLGKLMGKWTGIGAVRQSVSSDEEPVKCRLKSSWTSNNKLLRMFLTCRGIDYTFSATSFIGRSGETYRGIIKSSFKGQANVTGKRTQNGLTFTLLRSTMLGPVKSNLSLIIQNKKLINTLQRTDPDTGKEYTALEVTMKK